MHGATPIHMQYIHRLSLLLALLFRLLFGTGAFGQPTQGFVVDSTQAIAVSATLAREEQPGEDALGSLSLWLVSGEANRAHRWAHRAFRIQLEHRFNVTLTQHTPFPEEVSQELLLCAVAGQAHDVETHTTPAHRVLLVHPIWIVERYPQAAGQRLKGDPPAFRPRGLFTPLSMETDPAHEQLRCFTDRLLTLNEADWARFRDSFRPIHLVKGEYWLHAGDVCGHVGFIVSGLIQAYYIVQGEQVTQEFYFENTYATSYVSFLTSQPSLRYLQALDDTHLLILSREDLYRFYSGSQDAERMGRLIAEGAFMRFDYRTQQFLLKPPEQRYRDLLKDRPNVMQRVPQKLVASYLGIKPESLSRIRKRIAKG